MVDAKKLLEGTTPGPFEVMRGSEKGDDMRCSVVAVRGNYRYLVATIENGAPGDWCETEYENATMFAAAPDLAARVIELEAENAELRKQADALAEALERAVGELYAPEPGCSCHISPPCSDCADYACIREVNALGYAALAAYRSTKP